MAWMGLYKQLIIVSLTTSHEIMTSQIEAALFKDRNRGRRKRLTRNPKLQENPLFGLNFSTLQITIITRSKIQLLPSSSNNLRTFQFFSWTSWKTMLKPTSVQENWTYIDMHLWTRAGSGDLFPCHFYQWMAKLLINQLQNYYESTKSKLNQKQFRNWFTNWVLHLHCSNICCGWDG